MQFVKRATFVVIACGGVAPAPCRAQRLPPPIVASDSATVTVVADSLVPEAIGWVDGTLLVGSIARQRVFQVTGSGPTHALRPWSPPLGGPVLGMKVDRARGLLWAALMAPAGRGTGALAALSLRDGSVVRMIAAPPGRHMLNDLALTSDGTIYVTDSENAVVWTLAPHADTLAVAVPAEAGCTAANGIALSAGDSLLYVACAEGIRVGVPGASRLAELRAPAGAQLGGVDGLYYYAGALLGIQQPRTGERVIRIPLMAGGRAAGAEEILERRHPRYAIPTTGMILDDAFVYVANSQLDAWNAGRPITDTTYILRLPLREPRRSEAAAILSRYVAAWRGREEMTLADTMVFGVEVRGDGGGTFHVTLAPEGGATLAAGATPGEVPVFVTDIATLRALDADEISAMTAMARAKPADPAPLDVRMPAGFRWTPASQAVYLPLTFHFWNRAWPEVIRFGRSTDRPVHGARSAIFYYDRGLRTSWYDVQPGMHVNSDPVDQVNPFSSLIIMTRGSLRRDIPQPARGRGGVRPRGHGARTVGRRQRRGRVRADHVRGEGLTSLFVGLHQIPTPAGSRVGLPRCARRGLPLGRRRDR